MNNIIINFLLFFTLILIIVAFIYIYRRHCGKIEETEDLKQHLMIGMFALMLNLIFINIFYSNEDIFNKLVTAAYFLIGLDVSLVLHIIKQHK